MRTAAAIALGIVIGIASAAAAYLAVERPRVSSGARDEAASVDGRARLPPPGVPASSTAESPKPVAAAPRPTRAMPVTPNYGPAPETTRPIYRCASRDGTAYSNEPCAGATVVDETGAVAGYDSRPSARLAQLVAEGRGPTSTPPVAARPYAAPIRESVECASLRQQIRDIDAATARPNTREALDEWRRIRQDIRTGMVRSRC